MNDLISVIVPVYRVEQYLCKCVDSILNQTYQNLEIILVDDRSPDRCGEICDEYARKDNRVKVIHKDNGGLSDARNAGIEIATGEYLMFVDSDDYLPHNAVEILHCRIKQDQSDLVVGSIHCVDLDGQWLKDYGTQWLLNDDTYTALEYAFPKAVEFPMAVAKLYRKEILSDIRFPVGRLHEDEFTVHHIIGKCKLVSTVSEVVYFYLQRSSSIMHTVYDVSRLDAVDALLDRVVFYFNQKMYVPMQGAFLRVLVIAETLFSKLDKQNHTTKKRIGQLYRSIKSIGRRYIWEKAPLSVKIRLGIYFISPGLYHRVLWLVGKFKGANK